MTRQWRKRREIPDPMVRDAAKQYESARKLLHGTPGSGVLYPAMSTGAIAIELYLKCLSAEKVYIDAGNGWYKVPAKPQPGHGLATLLDQVDRDLQDKIEGAFQAQHPEFGVSFRDALGKCEGAFQASRYPYEPDNSVSKYQVKLLMDCSSFLEQFVEQLDTRETIEH